MYLPGTRYRATCEELLKEYKACESPDYISYVRTVEFVDEDEGLMKLEQGAPEGDQAA